MSLKELISVARGETPADLLLKNARIVNTFIGEIEQADVAIYGDRIAGVGNYGKAKEIIDLQGKFLAPGLINGHTHIESSMLHPARYAEAVVPRGTLAVVTDLHEIANVCGPEGIKFVTDLAQKLPLDMLFMAPSCVPATHLETSGAKISSKEVKKILAHPKIIGLGEMMNFPGVVSGDEEVLKKISASKGKVIDGHAPGLAGNELNAYLSAGILSDHESFCLWLPIIPIKDASLWWMTLVALIYFGKAILTLWSERLSTEGWSQFAQFRWQRLMLLSISDFIIEGALARVM